MRKYIFLPILLFCLSIGAITFVYGEINEDREVNTTATTLAGDVSKVHQLEIKNQVEYNYDHTYDWINWETTFTPVKTGETESTISYESLENMIHDETFLDFEDIPDAIYLFEPYLSTTEVTDGTLNIKDFVEEDLPEKALEDALEATSPGSTKTHTIHLKDYLSYCPAGSEFSAAGMEIKGDATDYLKIPVTDDMEYAIEVGKDKKGNFSSYRDMISEADDELSILNQSAVVNESHCYIAMDYYSCKGKQYPLDEKQRGIHVIPHTRKGVTNYLDFENAYLAYPLNEEEQLLSLNYSEDKKDLILITRDEKQTYVTVIEESSMKEKQKISAKLSMTDEEDSKILQEGDNILFLSKGNYALIAEKDGYYTAALSGSCYDFSLDFYDTDFTTFAYDGTQLAIIFAGHSDNSEIFDITELQVFDQTGLLYAGHYDNDLTPKNYSQPGLGRSIYGARPSLSFQNTK